jgi:uncharacterized protein YraI
MHAEDHRQGATFVPTSFRDALAHRPFPAIRRSSERGSALYRSVTFLTVFAMLFGGLLLLSPAGASAQSTATTTANLNLRQGPSTGTAIITTIPSGSSVTINGAAEAAFYPVTYNGMSGYAHGDWLAIGGSGSTPPPSSSGPTGSATVTAALNLRSGPSINNSILTLIPLGAAVTLTGEQANGFYSLTYNGISGYAASDWISVGSTPAPAPSNPGSGSTPVGSTPTGTATVTAYALNVRSGPSTSNSIVGAVTSGQVIDIMGDPQTGFYPMRAGSMTGWVSGQYISLGSAPAPAPSDPGSGSTPTGSTPTGTATVTAGVLNVRSGPSTSHSVITGITFGTTVELMGNAQGGFYPIRVNGISGWVSGDYLNIGGSSAPAPSPTPTPTPNPGSGSVPVGDTVVNTAVVTAAGLNMRSGPSTSYPVILGMAYGEQVEIMGEPQGGFYPIRYLGSKGWASGDYLNIGGTATPPRPGDGTYSQQEIIDIIYAAADRYGQSRTDMLRVARCESVLDPKAVNSSSGASGLFQFMPGTWLTTPYANQDIFDPVANANAAGWMWSVGRRNEWVCQ